MENEYLKYSIQLLKEMLDIMEDSPLKEHPIYDEVVKFLEKVYNFK